MQRIPYGQDPSQWVDLRRPSGDSRGLVVVIHGGFWKEKYDAAYVAPLAVDLTDRGWTTAVLEYRRVGNGGGFPATFDDVAAGVDAAAEATDRAVGPLVTLGHSAGGHLATWAAARTRFEQWLGAQPTHVVSLAGVLDLAAARRDGLGGGAVEALLGSDADDAAYAVVDPGRHRPLEVPVWCVHAQDDEDVPFSQSVDYVAAATAAGGEASLVQVTGGHFGLVDVSHEAWAAVVGVLTRS